MTMKNFCIAALCIMSVVFVAAVVGYFVFCIRVKSEKNAIRIKRRLKKNCIWWFCCWLIWVVVFLLDWSGAKKVSFVARNPQLVSAGGMYAVNDTRAALLVEEGEDSEESIVVYSFDSEKR